MDTSAELHDGNPNLLNLKNRRWERSRVNSSSTTSGRDQNLQIDTVELQDIFKKVVVQNFKKTSSCELCKF